MEEHQIGVNGLENNILVLNFAIRKREANEIKKLDQIKHFRNIEIREKRMRTESKQSELISIEQFQKNGSANLDYIINNKSKKPQYVLVDYEAKEE